MPTSSFKQLFSHFHWKFCNSSSGYRWYVFVWVPNRVEAHEEKLNWWRFTSDRFTHKKKLYKINWASRLHDVRKKKKQKTSVCLHARFYPKKKISFIKMRDLLMIFVSNFFIFFILCSTDELFCVISMDVMRCEMWRIDGWGESFNWAILYWDFLNIY